MEINRTGVPELVDGRDLKCLATPEWFSSFLENAISLSASTCWNEARSGKHFWGPLMALTVDTLLAAMRTARALHLHCRRIVFWNGRFAPEAASRKLNNNDVLFSLKTRSRSREM
jgi:hypothetical protein